MRTAISTEAAQGRLLSRPGPDPAPQAAVPGRQALGLATGRDGILLVPNGVSAGPLRLIVMVHGAGGNAAGTLGLIEDAAPGAILLLPERRGRSGDVIMRG